MFHNVGQPNATAAPRILLLQGPVGPFFCDLQDALFAQGFRPKRVVFNDGDRLFSSHDDTVSFAGSLDDWADWLSAELRQHWPEFIVLFGAMRPIHYIAKQVAAIYGVRVICLEEGYLRAGFVTCEIGGNNDSSPLCDWTPEQHCSDHIATPVTTRFSYYRMCLWGTVYYLARELKPTFAEKSLFHREHEGFFRLALSWAKHAGFRTAARVGSLATLRRIRKSLSQKFLLVPLQVPSDSQLKFAARGWSNERLVNETLQALAQAQTAESIVFKVHPLDRQAGKIRRLIRNRARDLGLSARVHILNSGTMSEVIGHATGMIVINSTSAFSALHQNIPTLVLGDAIYRHDCVVTLGQTQSDICDFLNERTAKPKVAIEAFFNAVKASALLPGDFYCADGRKVAAGAVAQKIAQLTGARAVARAGAA